MSEISNKDFGGVYPEAPAGCSYVQVGSSGETNYLGFSRGEGDGNWVQA